MNESMTHPMSTVLKGENMAPEPATYAWPGEDPVPLATTQFPSPPVGLDPKEDPRQYTTRLYAKSPGFEAAAGSQNAKNPGFRPI